MKLTKKQLTTMIKEAVQRSLKEFHKNQHTFTYNGLEIGPLTVQFIHHPVRPKTLYQPEEGGNIEVVGLSFNGKPVDEEQVANAENEIIVPMGEDPLTGEELLNRIQSEIERMGPDEFGL